MGRRQATDRATSTGDELDVFPTGTTIALEPIGPATDGSDADPVSYEPSEAQSIGDLLRQSGEMMRVGLEHARDIHARPGHRPGAAPVLAGTTSSRLGGDTDIVRPVLVSPVLASELATTGSLFDEPIPHLSIRHHDDAERRLLMWDAGLETGGRERRVTLHLRASPSMLVTVLELIPCRRPRYQRRQFLADGVAAVDVIARRLQRTAHMT